MATGSPGGAQVRHAKLFWYNIGMKNDAHSLSHAEPQRFSMTKESSEDMYLPMQMLQRNLLPHLQNAIDRIFSAKSKDYWRTIIMVTISPKDQANWIRNGIDSSAQLDLQAILKIIAANRNLLRTECGANITSEDLYNLKALRNTYAHYSHSIDRGTALFHIELLRKLVKWLRLPPSAIEDVESTGCQLDQLYSAHANKKCCSAVEYVTKSNVPTIEMVQTEYCAKQIESMHDMQKSIIQRAIANFYKKPESFELSKCRTLLYKAKLNDRWSAVVYNTPAKEYIFVSVQPNEIVEEWIDGHTVAYDPESGHMVISKVVQDGAGKKIDVVWANDTGEKDADLPDHGGGAPNHNPADAEEQTFDAMLKKNPERRSGFMVLNDKLAQMMYDGKLENWQVYLHEDQLRAVEMDAAGPMMVKGAAGTGKTVVLVHRAKWLLEHIFTGSERILVTTFNKSLEEVIRDMLKKICPEKLMARMDIISFDKLLGEYWKAVGGTAIQYEDDSYPHIVQLIGRLRDAVPELFEDTKRSDEFLCKEYDSVVEEFKVEKKEAYLEIIRPKAKPVVHKEERLKLWTIFYIFQNLFSNGAALDNRCSKIHAINKVTSAIADGKIKPEYASVLVDESQDMGASEYRLFAAMTRNTVAKPLPNSLFFAGDGNQRIYGRVGALKDCGINVHARSIKLKRCYRSSKSIKLFAESFLPESMPVDMDGVRDAVDGEALFDGEQPQVRFFEGTGRYADMERHVADRIKKWMSESNSSRYSDFAVLFRRGRSFGGNKTGRLERMKNALEEFGIPASMVSNKAFGDNGNTVKVMTMHRAKGMQFVGVVVEADGWPHIEKEENEALSKEAEEEHLDGERRLMYMALMRALRYVEITGCSAKTKLAIAAAKKRSSLDRKSFKEESAPAITQSYEVDRLRQFIFDKFPCGVRFESSADMEIIRNESGVVVTDVLLSALKKSLFMRSDGMCYHPDSLIPRAKRKRFLEESDKGGYVSKEIWLSKLRRMLNWWLSEKDLEKFARFLKELV